MKYALRGTRSGKGFIPGRWKNVKRKTDRDDALKLARLAALGQLQPVHIPPPRIRQWRQLLNERATLVGETTRCKNRIRAILRPQGLQLPAGKSGWTEIARVTLDEWAWGGVIARLA